MQHEENKDNEEDKERSSSSLGMLFLETSSAHPCNTAIHYHGDDESQLVTYHDLRTEVVKVRKVVSHHAAGDTEGSTGEGVEGSVGSTGWEEHRPAAQVVGVLSSGPEAVACILGVLVTCSYWYISPHYSKSEITVLVHRIRPELILVETQLLLKLDAISTKVLGTVSVLGTPFTLVSIITSASERYSLFYRPNNLAYVVPTSGTTAIPKCVYVPHSCIMPNVQDYLKLFKVTCEDRIFCAAPLTFDPSIIDLFLAFSVGAALVMVSPSTLRTPKAVLRILVENKVTILQSTPTLFLSLGCSRVRESLLSQGSWLRVLALGGEVFPSASLMKECVGEGCRARIFNMYGLTEVSCWASVWEYELHRESVTEHTPIGYPLSLTEIKVLKENGEAAANGEEGEIYVGGNMRMCFVDAGEGGVKGEAASNMRATGDVGLVKDGHIYCLGRLDGQLKRNGQKINIKEIECACSGLPYVMNCIVLPSRGKLIMFACICDKKITLDGIFKDLKNSLSPWKIPDEVVLIDSVPFNDHGKVDTQGLLSLKANSCYPVKHSQSLHDFFSDLWRRTLGCEDAKEDDSFIMCGGNSLTAVQVTARVEEFLGYEVPEFLDALLHNTYSEILQMMRRHNLVRESNVTSGILSKKVKTTRRVRQTLTKQKSTKNNDDVELSSTFLESQGSSDILIGESRKNAFTQTLHKLVAAVSRRGVEIREFTMIPSPLPLYYSLSLSSYSLRWKYNLEKCIDSSPLLAKLEDGSMIVFAGSHSNKMACLDAVIGTERWCCVLGDRVESSPAISRGGTRVYVGCYDHQLYCLSVEDGRIVWTYKTGGEVKSSPIVDQESGCVAFGSHDKQLHYVGVDGSPKWVLQVSSGNIFSSPCIVGELVVAATLDGVVCGVEKQSGHVRWKVAIHKPVFSSPASYSHGIVFGAIGGSVLSYSISGTFLWQYKTQENIFSSPFILRLRDNLEIIAIGSHDGCVYFLTHLGRLIGKYCCESPVFASPFLYPGDDECSFGAVLCETVGRCRVLRVKVEGEEQDDNTLKADMKVLWETMLPGELFASPVFCENKLWIGCRDDFLYCFEASHS